jgi:hypothetical protein
MSDELIDNFPIENRKGHGEREKRYLKNALGAYATRAGRLWKWKQLLATAEVALYRQNSGHFAGYCFGGGGIVNALADHHTMHSSESIPGGHP